MVKHIYGINIVKNPVITGVVIEKQIDVLTNAFMLANEYEVASLGRVIAVKVVVILDFYRKANIMASVCTTVKAVAELYAGSKLADTPLMNAVADFCMAHKPQVLSAAEKALSDLDPLGAQIIKRLNRS